jgi:hypothetical protein
VEYLPSQILNSKINFINLISVNYYLKQVISKVFQLFLLFGLFYLVFDKKIDNQSKNIFIAAGLIILLFLLLPFFSIDYSLTRFIQQILILLAPFSILGGKILSDKLKLDYLKVLPILLIIFFLAFSGFIPQLFGGDTAKIQLNNFGGDYDLHYMLYQDSSGISWLENNKENFDIYADSTASQKINSYGGKFNSVNTKFNLIPNAISKKDYVYLSTVNNLEKMGFFAIKGLKISYNYPGEFLEDNKNNIYSNGGSEIFK